LQDQKVDIIKVAIKQFIYESCIDVLFDNIQTNFFLSATDEVPKVGDFYKRISHFEDDEHYHNCVIREIEQRVSINKVSYYLLTVTYDYYNGEAFDYADEEDEEDFMDDYADLEDYDEDDEGADEQEFLEAQYGFFDYKKWYDDEKIDCIEIGPNLLSMNSKRYILYK
jgi:hypothetical protein